MELQPHPYWKRRILSAFLVFHLLATSGSVFKKTEVGEGIRDWTGSYERILGLRQRWGMFGPNPPQGSSYLMATGFAETAEPVELPVLVGEPNDRSFRWSYNRSLKLERSTFNPKTHLELRAGYGRWLCSQSAADGQMLTSVKLWKRRYMHLSPTERASGRTIEPVIKNIDLQVVDCPGGG